MKTLERALHDHELIVLRVIGEWWELDLTGSEKRECIQELVVALGSLDLEMELKYLGPEEAAAFKDLILSGGKIPVAAFERKHGNVRRMGPGKMEREEPWMDPVSPAEALWYRGFLYQAFDEIADNELAEYYYLPDEMNRQFEQMRASQLPNASEKQQIISPTDQPDSYRPATTWAVDDMTAILAAAQVDPIRENDLADLQPYLLDADLDRATLFLTLAWELNLLRLTDDGAKPARSAVNWLKKDRESQLRDLADGWSSSSWNDLCHTPGLLCDGSGWENDPVLARTALLDVLPRTTDWYHVADLVGYIKRLNPDFQRPDGNYDIWYIRQEESNQYLTGFESWDVVEGQFLQFLLHGPMHWLGLVESSEGSDRSRKSYRLTERCLGWLEEQPVKEKEEVVPVIVHDDATIAVACESDRYQRFQVARVSEQEPAQPNKPFQYRLTPRSLFLAKEQGIEADRLVDFLKKASGKELPISTERAIRRWDERGTEGRLQACIVLRVADPEILHKLRDNPKTAPYLGEFLGDLAVVVLDDDWDSLRRAAAQLGLLLGFEDGA